jgi:hypothetical protein
MVTGLEPALAKAASTSVARVATPVGGRLIAAIRKRQLKREFNTGASSTQMSDFLNGLDSAVAAELTEFAASAELKSLAMSLATTILLGSSGSKSNKISKEFKVQLRSLLKLNTSLEGENLDAAVEIIFASLSAAIGSAVSEVPDDRQLSSAAKASILKLQESCIDSAIRNSTLLSEISDLGEYKAFESQFRSQIKKLYGTMKLPHAGTTKRVRYDKLYVQPRVRLSADESNAVRSAAESSFTIEELLLNTQHVVLLGDPGGGKSTLSLKMTFDCASSTHLGDFQASVPFPLPLSIESCVPFWEIRFFDGDRVGDVLGMALAAFGGGSPGCPPASGPVAGQGDDFADQHPDLAFGAGGALPAVRAAGVGGDVVADEGEHGGERDQPRVGVGLRRGAGGGRGDHVVD